MGEKMADYARIDIFRNSTPLITLENILDADIRFTLGRANKFEITASNEAAEYVSPGFIKQGDIADIYLGQDDDYSKVMSGIVYKIEMPEDEITFTGFDWTDFLIGPKVARRYEYRDYGYILRDLIGTYSPKLSINYLLDTNQTIEGEYLTRYDELIEIIEDILDTIGYRLIVRTDKEVLIFPKEETPIFLDSFKTTLASDDLTWTYPIGWERDESNHILSHTTIEDNLYGKGVRKSTNYTDLVARCKIKFVDVAEGNNKWAGLSLMADGNGACYFGYLDQANQLLRVGENFSTPSTLSDPIEDGHIYQFDSSFSKENDTNGMEFGQSDGTSIYSHRRAYTEWDISAIPDSATITDVVFEYQGYRNSGSPSSIYQISHRPSTATANIIYDDIADGTAYLLNNTTFPEEGTSKKVGTDGNVAWTSLNELKTDLQDALSQDWFALGFFATTVDEFKTGHILRTEEFPAATPTPTLIVSFTLAEIPQTTTSLSLTTGVYYNLRLAKESSILTASVGNTTATFSIPIELPDTYATIDTDIKADFDDYGLYTISKHTLTENDLYDYSITSDISDITNRIILIGGNERIYDGFDTTLTLDRWTIPSGSTWSVSDGYLQPTTASYIFQGNQYWSYLDFKIDAKYDSSETYDFFYRRTSSAANHDDGFYVRLANNTLALICATDGTIASYTLASPPDTGDIFKINILANKNIHEVYFDNIRRIEIEDEHYPRGFMGIYATTSTQIDLINCQSDKKIIASAQDSGLFSYGLKEEVLILPKIRNRNEALSKASLELALKKIKKTSGKIVVPGDYKYSIGDTISLDLSESLEISPTEYLILDVSQKWKEREYSTELKIAEKIAGIEELIRQLRKETRGLAVREIELTDLIGSVEDTLTVLADESTYTRKDTGTFRLDEAQLEVSDLG